MTAEPRPLTAPAHADWTPPAAVLVLQLGVAVIVGANPLIVLLVMATTVAVLIAVLRARRIAPRRGPVGGIHYSERLIVAEPGSRLPDPVLVPADPLSATPSTAEPTAAGGDPAGNGHADGTRRTSLDWVASSIQLDPRGPQDPRKRNGRR